MSEPNRIEIAQPNPFGLIVDIQGNFHRGLMLGIVIGMFAATALIAAGALVVIAALR